MNLNKYTSTLSGAKSATAILGVACAGLSLALLISVSALASRHERIVVVPPGLSGPATVDWGRADTEYMKTFAVFYTTLLGTINPRNAEYVADRLSGMTSPDAYAQIRKSILAAAKDPAFAGSGSTSNFVSREVIHEVTTGLVFVVGENQTYSGFGQPKIAPVTYEMDVRIVEGRPVVYSVINYTGSEAHTAEWKLSHPNWDKVEVQK